MVQATRAEVREAKHPWRTPTRTLFRVMLPAYLGIFAVYALGLWIEWLSQSPDQDDVRLVAFLVPFVVAVVGLVWYAITAPDGTGGSTVRVAALVLIAFAAGFAWGEFFLPPLRRFSPDEDLAWTALAFPLAGLACLLWWSLVRPRLVTYLLGILVVPIVASLLGVGAYALLGLTSMGPYLHPAAEGGGVLGILGSLAALFAVGLFFAGRALSNPPTAGAKHVPGHVMRGPATLIALAWVTAGPLAVVTAVVVFWSALTERPGDGRHSRSTA